MQKGHGPNPCRLRAMTVRTPLTTALLLLVLPLVGDRRQSPAISQTGHHASECHTDLSAAQRKSSDHNATEPLITEDPARDTDKDNRSSLGQLSKESSAQHPMPGEGGPRRRPPPAGLLHGRDAGHASSQWPWPADDVCRDPPQPAPTTLTVCL